eukprot:CAMPEP_0172522412 /NCGR_PEP_ID=MMETSP1066-20121228/293104_1 /TAXON_ID=671091 /ORGANISM="Coscinodiscus wailesii, Strain CCMP2513" /LENGTH=200 /DNA_ID=CAMNT_0013305405 /DNA_START=482 /DNA_END=1084 /DNA_ORIENTATION=-
MELDSFRSKHEEIMSKEDSEKNALSKEISKLQQRIQFSSKPKDEVAAVKKSVSISSIKCSESISSSSRRQQSQNFAYQSAKSSWASSITGGGAGSSQNASWSEIKKPVVGKGSNPFLKEGIAESQDIHDAPPGQQGGFFSLTRRNDARPRVEREDSGGLGLGLLRRRGFRFGSGAALSGQETHAANKFEKIKDIQNEASL